MRSWTGLAVIGVLWLVACKQQPTPTPESSVQPAPIALAAPNFRDESLRQLTKEQLGERLIKASGGDELGVQIFEQIMAQFSQSNTIAPQLVETLRTKINASELVKLIVPIYTKHLTDVELIETIQFYESPTGKSVVGKLPVIAQESMMVSQTWGANLAQTVASELQAAMAASGAAGAAGGAPSVGIADTPKPAQPAAPATTSLGKP